MAHINYTVLTISTPKIGDLIVCIILMRDMQNSAHPEMAIFTDFGVGLKF